MAPLQTCAVLCTFWISWMSWLAPPSCPAVYLICKGVLWSSSTLSAKVLYSSHNPKWQQQHQDELQERGGSLSVIYNALNSSTLLIVCITKNQTWGKTNKKCHFLFRFNAIESTSLSLRSRLFTSGSVWSRNRDYGGGWKPLQTAFINTIKEWRHEKNGMRKKKGAERKEINKKRTGLGETGKGRKKKRGKKQLMVIENRHCREPNHTLHIVRQTFVREAGIRTAHRSGWGPLLKVLCGGPAGSSQDPALGERQRAVWLKCFLLG